MFEDLFSRTGLSLDRLRSFIQVADAGSIVKAANGDPVKQSQFSRQIKELEEFFGVQLLRRSGKSISVTPIGLELASLGRGQLTGMNDFVRVCRNTPIEMTLAAGESLLQWLILPKVACLQQDIPNAVIKLLNLRTKDIVHQLSEGKIDLGIVRQDAVEGLLKTHPLGAMSYCLIVPRGMLSKDFQEESDGLPKGISIAGMEGKGQFLRLLEDATQKGRISLKMVLRCSSFPMLAQVVKTGKYAAFLPSIVQAEFPREQYAILNPGFLKGLSRRQSLVWNPRTVAIRPVVEKVIAWVQQNIVLSK